MALQTVYQQFLGAPNSANLTADASLYYITTSTSIHGSTEIIKHFATLRKQLKKNKEAVLSSVESANGLALEIDTALEFITGGGPYLPRLDDNFLSDRKVYLPVTHFVSFDAQGKISQIRQSWDQGALLKQIDVIGKSGRNWPISDGTEQVKTIASAIAANSGSQESAAAAGANTDLPVRPRGNSALRDPHASLELFASREQMETLPAAVVSPYAGVRPKQRDVTDILNDNPPDEETAANAVVSPYAGRRPHQRSFADILGDEDGDEEEGDPAGDSPSRGRSVGSRARSQSPTKAIAPKAGSSKNYQPVRLFEADEAAAAAIDANSPEGQRFYRPNPKRYNHFDFADGSDPQDAPKAGTAFDALPRTKHNSQWSFEDFATPQKPPSRVTRGQEVRHFGIENDDFPETPSAASRKPAQLKPRRDAETHFEFQDDGEPSGAPRAAGKPRGAGQNDGLGLYKNNLYKEDGTAPTPAPARALGNITNLKDRSKIFEAHFVMADEQPAASDAAEPAGISDDRKKAVQMMESHWGAEFDDAEDAQKENVSIPGTHVSGKAGDQRGIQVGGDGMGGKKSGRSWSFGGEDDEAAPAVPGKKPNKATQASDFWNF
ncbi:hypothetical protein SPBR_04802 [Sporothrix brasiliensis 5110]|uniref:Ntf2-like protein n=1 Tax=Sporothrix brasiliensis 5110 TaxID=1398154 RepID=A0A0C2ILH3_9PEZI|nr:uncharacterized protein SPBR_04802 [Sporothrix brasiliensis 5110]KIH87860.1 hypothetical protein SPBR_04802 [Sporothrix brasiliensis 5110]